MLFGPTFFDSINQSQPERDLAISGIGNANLLWRSVLIIGILLLSVRLIQLQVLAGDENRQLADEQRIRLVQIPAARGLITDRNDQIIAQNKPIFRRLTIDPHTGVRLDPITRDQALQLEAGGYAADLVEGVGRNYSVGPEAAHLLGYLAEANQAEDRKSVV